MDLRDCVWTPHAVRQIAARSISRDEIASVLAKPDRIDPVRTGRIVAQGRVVHKGSAYLIRVFIDVGREPFEIVTAYRTSKMAKYESPRGR